MANNCRRCGKETKLLRTYCPECSRLRAQVESSFDRRARHILRNGTPLSDEWNELVAWVRSTGYPVDKMTDKIHGESMQWVDRAVAHTMTGEVTKDDIAAFDRAVASLFVNASNLAYARNQLVRAEFFARARRGHLPVVARPTVYLPTDEICYLDAAATRLVSIASGTRSTNGRLVVTNRKVRFSAMASGNEVGWNRVHNVHRSEDGVSFEATSQAMRGQFLVEDPEWAQLVAYTTMLISKRVILGPGERDSRTIPHHVKAEVYRRDRGKCVECGSAESIEYDHIIPHSRGGASSIANLQILCRPCNARKGARI